MNNTINIENLQLASMRSRIKAFIIDDLSITLLVMLMLWDKIASANGELIEIMTIMNEAFLQIIVLKFLYQTFLYGIMVLPWANWLQK